MDLKQYRSKLIGSEDERAVSPVIGVILMVAITVILAAVIAAFVLDMGSNQSSPAQAGVSLSETGTSGVYDVTINSMGDNTDSVQCVDANTSNTAGGSASSVGSTFECGAGDNIVATTNSGDENVIQSDIGN